MSDTISKKEVKKLPLRGKPRCPRCNNPLSFVYDVFDEPRGLMGEKCKKCGQECLVDIETLKVTIVLDEAS